MAKSLKLINGDLVFDNLGKLYWIDESERIIQAINLRLNTILGDLFYNEEYGIEKIRGKVTKELLESYLSRALLKDSDIRLIEINSLNKIDNNSWSANINVYIYSLNTNQNLTIPINL